MKKPIYMDYMATTPVDPRVREKMNHYLDESGVFGNPASRSHLYGYEAEEAVAQAGEQVAALINATRREIIWTSGATESNNLAIKGAAEFYQRKGKHIITMSTEHKAVLDTCRFLEAKGFEVTYLSPTATGALDLSKLENAMRLDTVLVSIMHVNNETGVIQDIQKIAEIAHQHGAIYHCDAAQSAGKVKIDVREMKIDLLSLSGHKLYGPKGIGALFVSHTPRIRLEPQIHGGSQQQGLRSGTLATHQIVGMGEAFAVASERFEIDKKNILNYRRKFLEILSSLKGLHINGDPVHHIPGCLNIRIEGVDLESFLLALNKIAISTGSACNSVNPEPSHVLTAMGLTRIEANSSVRISMGRFTSEKDVEEAGHHFVETINQLRQRSNLWDEAAQRAISKDK